VSGLGFVCVCGHPDAHGRHGRSECVLGSPYPRPAPASDARRLAEFRARLDLVAAGLESALQEVDRSNDVVRAMLRDVRDWADSLGGRP